MFASFALIRALVRPIHHEVSDPMLALAQPSRRPSPLPSPANHDRDNEEELSLERWPYDRDAR